MAGMATEGDEIGFPIVDGSDGVAAAMSAMRAYRIGGVAVPVGNKFALVRARDILESSPRDKSLSALADDVPDAPGGQRSFTAAQAKRVTRGLLVLDPTKVALAMFDLPSAHKQCTVNPNHQFEPDLDEKKCPLNDGGDLILVF